MSLYLPYLLEHYKFLIIFALKFEQVHLTTGWCVFKTAGWVTNSIERYHILWPLIWVYTKAGTINRIID